MNFYATGTTNNDNGKAKILILSFDKEGNDLAKTSSKGYESYEYSFKFTYPEEFQEGIRVDSGTFEGGEVSIYYDPMIAKLIVWGENREQARERMMEALDSFDIRGVTTNMVFLNALISHPAFASGDISTGFIGEEYPDGFVGNAGSREQQELFAAIAGYLRAEERLRAASVHPSDADSPWKILKRAGSGNWATEWN